MASEPAAAGGREPPGVATLPVAVAAMAFLLFVAAALAGLHLYLRTAVDQPVAVPPEPFPEPRLQRYARAELAAALAEQRARLTGWAWADREAGLVRVPIERAMALIAARGAHAFEPLLEPARPFRPGDPAQGSAPP